MADVPKIVIDEEAEEYVRAVVDATPGEVGGWFYCKRDGEKGDFRVYKFVVLPQEAGAANVDFDDEGMHKEMTRAMDDGEINNLRGSWHSHGSMGVYFSSTDEEAIQKYKEASTPYLISLIYNRKGEVKTRLDVFDSEAMAHIYMEDLTYAVDRPKPEESDIQKRAKADVKELVRKNAPSTSPTNVYGWGDDWYDGYGHDQSIVWESHPHQRKYHGKDLDMLDKGEWAEFVEEQYGSPLKDLEDWGATVGIRRDGRSFITFPLMGSEDALPEPGKGKEVTKK